VRATRFTFIKEKNMYPRLIFQTSLLSVLLFFLAFSFSGCGGGGSSDSDTDDSSSEPSTPHALHCCFRPPNPMAVHYGWDGSLLNPEVLSQFRIGPGLHVVT